MFEAPQLNVANLSRFLPGAFPLNPAVLGNGTAAAPSLSFASNPNTGIYRVSTNVLGFAATGVQWGYLTQQNVIGVKDNSTLVLGRSQTTSTSGAEHYPSTIRTESQTLTGDSAIVLLNIGDNSVTFDSGTKTSPSWNTEMDKLEVYSSGGAVTISRNLGGVRFRLPITKTNVTAAQVFGLGFTIPNASDVTGTSTMMACIDFPPTTGAAYVPPGGIYGLYFEEGYTQHITTKTGYDLTIGSGNGITLTAATSQSISATAFTMTLNALSTSGAINLQNQGSNVLRIGQKGATAIANGYNLRIDINNTPSLFVETSSGSAGLAISSKGSSIDFYTTSVETGQQVRILATGTPTNHVTLTGGAAGSNPVISTSGVNLQLMTGGALATNATAGFILIPAMSGTPSGAPTGAGAGAVPFVYDTSSNKIWLYNGSWRGVAVT